MEASGAGESSSAGASHSHAHQSSHRRRRGRRGGASQPAQPLEGPKSNPPQPTPRGRGRGRQRFSGTKITPAHQFSGQLTRDDDDDDSVRIEEHTEAQLNAAAAEFTPGAPISQLPNSTSKGKEPASQSKGKKPGKGGLHGGTARRASISSAPDIGTRRHEDIANGVYECAVCTNELRKNSKVWACRICWAVFHLSCIKKWATSEGSAVKQTPLQDGHDRAPRMWRCPGCNLAQDTIPDRFTCWCEKEQDPAPLTGLTPFSCGQTCGRPRQCPHPCALMCHAGPCPPCAQMGPSQSCFCGSHTKTSRCADTDYTNGFSCGRACNELMPCGKHYCPRPCHEGLCGSCEVPIDSRCFCGKVTADIPCSEIIEEKQSFKSDVGEDGEALVTQWTGTFDCGQICNRDYDCGFHQCEKACHSQDSETQHCPRSPDVVSHCPCGKTELSDISSILRTSCRDPIPFCRKPCSKLLDCGHNCGRLCHEGECKPCLEKMDITCACGRVTSKTICHQGSIEPPRCMKVCKALKNCGRHECGERCCPGERLAAERTSKSKKRSALNAAPPPEEYEAEHFCTETCGRPLKCGDPEHTCQSLCHRGPCGNCLDAIFEELSCNCGRTTLQPPLPCGTKPPACKFPCTRSVPCGHPLVQHNCHQDEEACPKCPYLVTKPCLCGKHQLRNQPCWNNKVQCGEVCGKLLKCGGHRCRKTCHAPGECEDFDKPCHQLCGKYRACGHACGSACHSPFHCKEDTPCQFKILITCPCQRIKKELSCGASKGDAGNITKALVCDNECLRLERNRKLQLALNIDPSHTDDHVPYSQTTIDLYSANPAWAQAQEKTLREFAVDPDEKRLRFKPMRGQERAFIHAMAEDFGFDSTSMDPEPHRHVSIFKTPRFVMAPMKTVARCVRIRTQQQAAEKAERSSGINNVASNAPFNAYLVTDARFGLTLEELRAVLPKPPPQIDIFFLPSEEIVLKVPPTHESRLESFKGTLAKDISDKGIGSVQLCHVDEFLNVLRRESDTAPKGPAATAGGWSTIAAKPAPSRKLVAPPPVQPAKSGFLVLRTLNQESKSKNEKKAKVEDVVDDWEDEISKED